MFIEIYVICEVPFYIINMINFDLELTLFGRMLHPCIKINICLKSLKFFMEIKIKDS